MNPTLNRCLAKLLCCSVLTTATVMTTRVVAQNASPPSQNPTPGTGETRSVEATGLSELTGFPGAGLRGWRALGIEAFQPLAARVLLVGVHAEGISRHLTDDEREVLIDHALDAHLSTDEITTADPRVVFALSSLVGRFGTEAQRRACTTRLREVFVQDTDKLGGLSREELFELRLVWVVLPQDGPGMVSLTARWCRATDRWKGYNAGGLALLLRDLAADGGVRGDLDPSTAEAAERITHHAWAKFLKSKEAWSGSALNSNLIDLADAASDHLNDSQRQRVRTLLLQATADSGDPLASLSVQKVRVLTRTLTRLSGPPEGSPEVDQLINRWASAMGDRWDTQSTDELLDALNWLDQRSTPGTSKLADTLAARLMAEPQFGPRLMNLASLPVLTRHVSKRQLSQMRDRYLQWVDGGAWIGPRPMEEALDLAEQIAGLCAALGASGDGYSRTQMIQRVLTGVDAWYPFRLEPLTRYGQTYRYDRVIYWRYRDIADRLGDEGIAHLREGLNQARLEPRPTVLYTLAWHYRQRGELNAWRVYLQERIDGTVPGSTSRLGWQLGRAYAQELTELEPTPGLGRRWTDQALAETTSEDALLALVRLMFSQEVSRGRYNQAASLLASFSTQLDSAAGREQLRLMDGMIGQLRRADAVIRAERKRLVQANRLRGEIASLHQHMDKLQQQGRSSQDIESVRRVITQAESQLAAIP